MARWIRCRFVWNKNYKNVDANLWNFITSIFLVRFGCMDYCWTLNEFIYVSFLRFILDILTFWHFGKSQILFENQLKFDLWCEKMYWIEWDFPLFPTRPVVFLSTSFCSWTKIHLYGIPCNMNRENVSRVRARTPGWILARQIWTLTRSTLLCPFKFAFWKIWHFGILHSCIFHSS